MNGFERRKQQKMEQIRQAAFSLFAKSGVQKVNIQEIAKGAGVSQVTIYNYYGSKDNLISDVVKHYLHSQLERFMLIKESSLSFTEKMARLMEDKLASNDEISSEFLINLVDENSAIAEMVQAFSMERSFPLILDFLEEGRKSGDISENLSTNTIFFFMQSFSDSIRKYSEILASEEQKNRFVKESIYFFLYGLLGINKNK
ncbi:MULTISPECIES: TetR/AcrR family transcriptional regulator [unclassified Bacillus (in: firmicutes)]|uniref:TetR/AcrR family transcriptional regulator n=1 Tax=unclassified Bacillus (in: firmicutes) TaxID=185979 RepID=UPI0008EB72E4|nr:MULTISPECIES: TetR/AcrR family transcriptional regulator [unclassified Bacillus (in: firmicutes)]SFA80911.1 DNA-binding transcriptional regulator, AcrR family [Bacillus sp. UNCCL13]SFQ71056.1 DNA-binding transcriptional regulator, AcrR family [Bacillus sp. cl95]